MALRHYASQFASRVGVQLQPTGSAGTVSGLFGLAASRAMATVVDGLKYAKSHEWVKQDGDVATIGISDFAQAELGDLVYVETPEVGDEIEKGENFGVVESVKAASDVYLPVSGEVIEINESLAEDAAQVNSDPFGAGWIVKVKMSDPSELDSLMDAQAYTASCEH